MNSHAYDVEIAKFFPDVTITSEFCPMWVPLIENNQYDTPGARYFIELNLKNLLAKDPQIDTILL